MSVDDSPLYRKSRNHISFVDLEQPGIYRRIHANIEFFFFILTLPFNETFNFHDYLDFLVQGKHLIYR